MGGNFFHKKAELPLEMSRPKKGFGLMSAAFLTFRLNQDGDYP